MCSLIFYYSKEGIKETVNFCVKNEIKRPKTFEKLTTAFGWSTMIRTQVLKSDIIGLRSVEKISMTPGPPPSSSTIDEGR